MTRLLLVTALCLWGAALGVWAQATESDAPQASVRALRRVTSTSQARATVLATNGGWQPIYSQTIEAGQGDLLRLIGQTQLTLDSAPRVGQQLRLTVNGQPVGGQSIEINTTPALRVPVMTGVAPEAVGCLVLGDEPGRIPVTLILCDQALHDDLRAVVPIQPDSGWVIGGRCGVGNTPLAAPESRPR